MISGCREVLNNYLPDVWVYSDHSKNVECASYGLALMAERFWLIFSDKGSLITGEEIYDAS